MPETSSPTTYTLSTLRLDQFLSLCSIGTRKKVKEYIYNGTVSINGQICQVPATIIDAKKDTITYQETILQIAPVYYLLNKPQNCICARVPDCFTVFDCLQNLDTTGLFSIGRLDKDTEGLLLLTNDGILNHQLMWPDHHITKTYYFLALGIITPEKIKELESGIAIGPDEVTKPAHFQVIKTGLYDTLASEIGTEKLTPTRKRPPNQQAFIGQLTITEGKKHQVKRMLRHIRCPIVYLKRIAIGSLYLEETMAEGSYRKLSLEELSFLLPN